MPVKIDRTKWSNSSRISSEYTGLFRASEFYSESIFYRCRKCFCQCAFTPEQQKVAFEDHKKIIHYVPSLCSDCAEKYAELKALVDNYQSTWNHDRLHLASDRKFMSDWLRAVREKNSYGKRIDLGRERMLSKLLLAMWND